MTNENWDAYRGGIYDAWESFENVEEIAQNEQRKQLADWTRQKTEAKNLLRNLAYVEIL